MWVTGLLALSAGTAAAAADCGADLNDGGEALAAAQLVLVLAWLFVFITAGEIVLFVFWSKLRRQKVDAALSAEAAESSLAGYEPEDVDETASENGARAPALSAWAGAGSSPAG